jgi:hypothetical protein
MVGDPRLTTWQYRQMRAAFIRAAQPTCTADFCKHPNGRAVDTGLPGNHRWAPTIDHTAPTSINPEVFWNTSLWRLQHRACNSARGNGVTSGLGSGANKTRHPGPSRRWVW